MLSDLSASCVHLFRLPKLNRTFTCFHLLDDAGFHGGLAYSRLHPNQADFRKSLIVMVSREAFHRDGHVFAVGSRLVLTTVLQTYTGSVGAHIGQQFNVKRLNVTDFHLLNSRFYFNFRFHFDFYFYFYAAKVVFLSHICSKKVQICEIYNQSK